METVEFGKKVTLRIKVKFGYKITKNVRVSVISGQWGRHCIWSCSRMSYNIRGMGTTFYLFDKIRLSTIELHIPIRFNQIECLKTVFASNCINTGFIR